MPFSLAQATIKRNHPLFLRGHDPAGLRLVVNCKFAPERWLRCVVGLDVYVGTTTNVASMAGSDVRPPPHQDMGQGTRQKLSIKLAQPGACSPSQRKVIVQFLVAVLPT